MKLFAGAVIAWDDGGRVCVGEGGRGGGGGGGVGRGCVLCQGLSW